MFFFSGLKEKFIVLSHPRCGTTYFCDPVLTSHPSIACFDEVFVGNELTIKAMQDLGIPRYNRYQRSDNKDYANEVEFLKIFLKKAVRKKRKRIIGFKLFHHQVSEEALFKLLDTYKIIFILRRNMPQAALSYAISLKTKQWYAKSKADFAPFEVNFEELMAFIQKYDEGLNICKDYLQKNNIHFLSLEYESLFTLNTLKRVQGFLNLKIPFDRKEFGKTKMSDIDRYQLIQNIETIRKEFINRDYPDIYEIVYRDKII